MEFIGQNIRSSQADSVNFSVYAAPLKGGRRQINQMNGRSISITHRTGSVRSWSRCIHNVSHKVGQVPSAAVSLNKLSSWPTVNKSFVTAIQIRASANISMCYSVFVGHCSRLLHGCSSHYGCLGHRRKRIDYYVKAAIRLADEALHGHEATCKLSVRKLIPAPDAIITHTGLHINIDSAMYIAESAAWERAIIDT